MDLIGSEESASLKPHSASQSGRSKSGHSGRSSESGVCLHPERRLDTVRLSGWCYLSWVLLILASSLIPLYQWYFIDEPDCWSARYGQIMVSIFAAMLTGLVASLLLLLNCLVRVNMSTWRLNFCTMVSVVLIIVAFVNFLTGIYLFSLTTCYFDQLTPVERLRAVFDQTGQSEAQTDPSRNPNTTIDGANTSDDDNQDGGGSIFDMVSTTFSWLHLVALKYDLKIVGIFHLICCLTAFGTGMGFAIIKNNFKYVRQVDFD